MVKTETKTKKDPAKKNPGTAIAPRPRRSNSEELTGAEVSTPLPAAVAGIADGQQPAALLTRSGRIDKIASAMALAQSEFTTVKKNCEVDFFSKKTNQRIYYKYADLASVVETARPILAKHKLSVSQMPVRCKGGVHITTILMHTSGQFLQSTLSLEVVSNDVKEVGTVITYGRRYALASILGIVTDEDIDAPSNKETADGVPTKITQLCRKLNTAAIQAGGKPEEVMSWLRTRYGIKEASSEMTEAQLEEAIKIMEKKAAEKKTKRGKPAAKGNGDGQKKTA